MMLLKHELLSIHDFNSQSDSRILWCQTSPWMFGEYGFCISKIGSSAFSTTWWMNRRKHLLNITQIYTKKKHTHTHICIHSVCDLSVSGRLWSGVSAVTDNVIDAVGRITWHWWEMKWAVVCKVTKNFPSSTKILRSLHQHGRWTETLQRARSYITG